MGYGTIGALEAHTLSLLSTSRRRRDTRQTSNLMRSPSRNEQNLASIALCVHCSMHGVCALSLLHVSLLISFRTCIQMFVVSLVAGDDRSRAWEWPRTFHHSFATKALFACAFTGSQRWTLLFEMCGSWWRIGYAGCRKLAMQMWGVAKCDDVTSNEKDSHFKASCLAI